MVTMRCTKAGRVHMRQMKRIVNVLASMQLVKGLYKRLSGVVIRLTAAIIAPTLATHHNP